MMIAEKNRTAQQIIEAIHAKANKVAFIDDSKIVDSIRFLEEHGFPNTKVEDYKYCNLDAIIRKEFKAIQNNLLILSKEDIKPYLLNEGINLVVVNGNYDPELSDKLIVKGITIKNLNGLSAASNYGISTLADPSKDAFVALNTAYSENGLALIIGDNQNIPMPLQVIYINHSNSESLINPRSIIKLGRNSGLRLVERFVTIGNGKIFSNNLSEKFVDNDSNLESIIIQDNGANSFEVNTNEVVLRTNSNYSSVTITLSGSVVRNNHHVTLSEQYANANLYGLFFTRDHQLVDNHTLMNHQMPHCESSELYKGVLKDKSTGVFNGKIYVKKDAQKTNAYQSSKNILLSDDATINTKPELEIYANDVKCSHGTSTGKIDEEALFYLKSRGIGEESGKKLLLQAFAGEVLDKIKLDGLKEYIQNRLAEI